MVVHQWRSTLHRWQQLTRYYVNRWQYDGAKWAERVWYGKGSQTSKTVASVPFMITQSMRQELTAAGFPSHEISSLLPKTAHALIRDKVSYAQYQQQQEQAQQQQQSQQDSGDSATEHAEIKEIVAVIQAREQAASTTANAPSTSTQIALVPDSSEDKRS